MLLLLPLELKEETAFKFFWTDRRERPAALLRRFQGILPLPLRKATAWSEAEEGRRELRTRRRRGSAWWDKGTRPTREGEGERRRTLAEGGARCCCRGRRRRGGGGSGGDLKVCGTGRGLKNGTEIKQQKEKHKPKTKNCGSRRHVCMGLFE